MIDSLIAKEHGKVTGILDNTANCWLSKLTCHQDDEHPGILPTASSAPSSDLVYACKFSRSPGYGHMLAIANEEGRLAFQNTNIVGKSMPLRGLQAHDNAIFDVCWSPHSTKIITASGDQSSVIWDLGPASIDPISKFIGHTASLKTVDFSPTSDTIFASGARDGAILLWDARNYGNQTKAENVIKFAHPIQSHPDPKSSKSKKKSSGTPGSSVNSVTSVIFQDEHTLISSGATDGYICVWDLRKNYAIYKGDPIPKMKINYGAYSNQSGITSLCFDPAKNYLYAASRDHVIYEYNMVSYDENPIGVYGGHEQHSFYIKTCLSGDGRYLLSGSSDDYAYIWKVGGGPRPLFKLDGHAAEVTCVAWCPSDITKIVTCGDDVRHRVWRPNSFSETDFEEKLQIRGRSLPVDHNCPIPSSCREVLNRLEKRKTSTASNPPVNNYCKTPSSLRKFAPLAAQRTPEPGTSASGLNTPRAVLSPVPSNVSPEASIANNRGASRRLDMESTAYPSPTSDLPNLVVDGRSPHRNTPRSSSKRKRLDWLTDLSRKMTPNKCRKIK